MRMKGLQIVSAENPSPAKLAGLQAVNDIITAVDGETVADLGYQEVINGVRGEANTSVELTIQRGKTELKKTVQRQEMQVTSAYGTMLENKIDIFALPFKEKYCGTVPKCIESAAETRCKRTGV